MYNFIKPSNWNDLLLHQKIYIYLHKSSINEYHSNFLDKINAKLIVKNLCGDRIKISPIIKILNSDNDINNDDINNKYLLKANRYYDKIIDLQSEKNINQIKKKLIDWKKELIKINIKKFQNIKYFIEEKIICKYNNLTNHAVDFKFFCFNGNPQLLLVRKYNSNKTDPYDRNFYDINWNLVMPKEHDIEKPDCFSEMIELCKILSKQFEFVRIDLYLGIDGIYFGEFTFTPNAGIKKMSDYVEKEFSKFWT
jgi:hypothetical protein